METAMHRNGLGSLLPFPLTPVSRQTGTRLVLPLSSSAGDACWVLKMEKLCGLLEGDRRRRWIFYLLVFSCPGFYFTLLFASRWLCLYKPGPLKKRGLRANDVAGNQSFERYAAHSFAFPSEIRMCPGRVDCLCILHEVRRYAHCHLGVIIHRFQTHPQDL